MTTGRPGGANASPPAASPYGCALASAAAEAGAGRLRDRTAATLRDLGERPAVARTRGPQRDLDVLSRREREVADLVTAGRANKEVADALFLSAKTVENTLSRIYAKLGVASRTELAALLAQRDADTQERDPDP